MTSAAVTEGYLFPSWRNTALKISFEESINRLDNAAGHELH
jgi:hypothetical protein